MRSFLKAIVKELTRAPKSRRAAPEARQVHLHLEDLEGRLVLTPPTLTGATFLMGNGNGLEINWEEPATESSTRTFVGYYFDRQHAMPFILVTGTLKDNGELTTAISFTGFQTTGFSWESVSFDGNITQYRDLGNAYHIDGLADSVGFDFYSWDHFRDYNDYQTHISGDNFVW